MKEIEAISILSKIPLCTPLGEAAFRAVECMKELQGYREIGADRIRNLITLYSVENEKDILRMLKELSEYRKIGTVEECRDAVNRQEPMEIQEIHVDEYFCPRCGSENNCDQKRVDDKFCPNCGQALGCSGYDS